MSRNAHRPHTPLTVVNVPRSSIDGCFRGCLVLVLGIIVFFIVLPFIGAIAADGSVDRAAGEMQERVIDLEVEVEVEDAER